MELISRKSTLSGSVEMPASKSHTMRAVTIASLAEGRSVIESPLESLDTEAAANAYRALGARIACTDRRWEVDGVAGKPAVPENVIDVANSGTTLRVVMGAAALADGYTVLTGDEQIRNRPVGPLAQALGDLGAAAFTTRDNGRPPVVIRGVLSGGEATVEAATSQYVTSLLLCAPLARARGALNVTGLNEAPYVWMTLRWLADQGVSVSHDEALSRFEIQGGQRYRPVRGRVPADWSSATFFMVAAAVTKGEVVLRGLDPDDTQGDKAVADMLRAMGADVTVRAGEVVVRGGELTGRELDLNATPDALPALAVAGCFARGETRLVNVPQARLKETDRIAVMCRELSRLGADVEECDDALVIRESALRGASVHGHADHRVVMALALAGLCAQGDTRIDTAESVSVTFPDFVDLMRGLGADMHVEA